MRLCIGTGALVSRISLALATSSLFLCLATSSVARAQAFPGDPGWTALPCGNQRLMVDGLGDTAGFADALDLVGDATVPAGYRAVDADFLYLRMRLDATPQLPNGNLMGSTWGWAFDLDDDRTDYELLVLASGATQRVDVFTNGTTTLPNRLADPADLPSVASHPFIDNGRTVVGSLSDFGGDVDRFLDVAIPWTDLEPLGLEPLTPISVWAGSSTLPNGLDGDIACSGSGGGDADMDGVVTGRTVADPDTDSDGDGSSDAIEVEAGTDPGDATDIPDDGDPGPGPGPGAGTGRLEGGGGCAIGGHGGPGSRVVLAGLLLAVAAGWKRRTRRRRP